MSETHYIIDMLVLLSAAVVAVPVFQRLGLGSVLGYLAAGAAVGPWGLGLIVAVEEIRNFAELGVVFLLFVLGIELKPARLWVMRHVVFGLGSAQVILTGLLLFGMALTLGVSMNTALIAGFGLALSSTAFGLQILSERGELNTVHGRAAFGILLLQDLAVVPLIALVRLLAEKSTSVGEDVGLAALETVLFFSAVIVFGRFLLRPVLGLVAGSRNSEVFAAAAVLLVLGTGWLMEQVGFSMALGAFLAGLLLADSPYRHQIVADVQPFRGFLLGLFFMAVGMSLNFSIIASQGMMLVGLVIGMLCIKTSVLWVLCRGVKYSNADST